MKIKFLFLITLMPAVAFEQVCKNHSVRNGRLSIQLDDGRLYITPRSDKVIRVQWEKGMEEERDFVLINKLPAPAFKFSETPSKLKHSSNSITAVFNKQTGVIDYSNHTGKIFLSERAGRKLKPDTTGWQNCFVAEQSFDSPRDEYLFGPGQFQDGYYNFRNVTRKLIVSILNWAIIHWRKNQAGKYVFSN